MEGTRGRGLFLKGDEVRFVESGENRAYLGDASWFAHPQSRN
jgi:hypothetical protein